MCNAAVNLVTTGVYPYYDTPGPEYTHTYTNYTCIGARINQKTNHNYTLLVAMCHKITALEISIAVDTDAVTA